MWPMLSWFSRIDRVSEKPLLPYAGGALPKALGTVGAMVLSMGVLTVCAIMVWWSAHTVPLNRFFLVNQGRATEVFVRTNPGLGNVKVQRWSSHAVADIMSFNFNDLNSDLKEIQDTRVERLRPYFTEAGWAAYQVGVNFSPMFRDVHDKQLDVLTVPMKEGRVVKNLTYGDIAVWQVQVPVLMIYRSASSEVTRQFVADLEIRQVPTTESPDGIGIVKLGFRPYR